MQLKILLVDDDMISLKKLRALLSPYGECHMVMEGEKALEMFERAHSNGSPYGLVTLDIDMPKLGGVGVLKRIRAWEQEKGENQRPVKILMTSSHDEKEMIESAMNSGCTHYLLKPYNAQKIEEAMIKVWKAHSSFQAVKPDPPPPADPGYSFKRILVTDDEIVSLSKLKVLLSKLGPCETARNGQEALDKFMRAHDEENPYELITLDIDMPGMKGPDVLKEIRKWEAQRVISPHRAVKVLMVTAFSDKDLVMESIRSGCTNYIVKPFDGKKLEEALAKLPGKVHA